MSVEAERLKERAWRFVLDVIARLRQLPDDDTCKVVGRQLAKSATSVAFNYRAACRARTHTEFTSKLSVVAEEADETAGWLDLIADAGLMATSERLARLRQESRELVAIFSASVGTARRKSR
jgi:four helix bundle protein